MPNNRLDDGYFFVSCCYIPVYYHIEILFDVKYLFYLKKKNLLSCSYFTSSIFFLYICFTFPTLTFLHPLSRQRLAVTWTKRVMKRVKKFLALWGGRCRCKKRIQCRWVNSVQDLVLLLLCDTLQCWYERKIYD